MERRRGSKVTEHVDRRDLVLLRITMVHMFPVATKQAMYASLVEHLEVAGLRRENLLISVVEVGFEDWYAGGPINERGERQ